MADCIDEITDAFEDVFESRGGGHDNRKHDGTARSCIVPFIDQHERLCALLDDPRIHGILSSILGEDFNYMGSDGNYYVGDTDWHSDGWNNATLYAKIAFYLDPLTRDTGCLRVVPGSHHVGDEYADALQDQLRGSRENWAVHGSEVPALALEVTPGDVLLFNHQMKHSTWGGGTRRRMFTINCGEHVHEDNIDSLKDYIAGNARFWIDSVYGGVMVKTAGPQRIRHLKQVMENQGHLPALAAEARKRTEEPSRG